MQMNKRVISWGCAVLFVASFLTSCEGRKMSNMTPTGDTVEVNVSNPDTETDSLGMEDPLDASI